jgi:prophage regulatory protein
MQSLNPQSTHPPVRMLRLRDVLRRTALSRSQIYRLISLREFPRQIPLGARAAGWIEHEIDQWLIDRINSARRP